MVFFRRLEGGPCCDEHREHVEECNCSYCTKPTNGKILEITWGAVTHTRPYYYDDKEFGERVRQCLDSRLMEDPRCGLIRGRRPYKMYRKIKRDPIDLAILYTICIVFKKDPGWRRLWEKVTHTVTGECLLPIHPKTIHFKYTSNLH
ncbi:hypothetical protein EDB81DRAFT_859496 [Dactylonectria macrodidyma]|uniref:Uncharacterized protein n=1 Tax=Dactylonectria macrodidyma TaxID=307937 RepID=A0A9P9CZG8_9HYPO|nr:hypothetical protein EDB81DRAFT_769105 [Dactylonectria macrodidyma]KAH7111451.1 hypothetical protein EDB81DRAFT_862932 [Dactylonectria macrodidyma]KAH7132882.1 hypothetical protein EDB81DRAFT_859496 [Dactylonectria macrodidyma]